MRQIGAGEAEGDYGFTTTEERKNKYCESMDPEETIVSSGSLILFR